MYLVSPKSALFHIMFENNPHNGLGASGESYLVGHDLLMRSTSRFYSSSEYKTKVSTQGVHNALNSEPGNQVIRDYRGISVFSAYEHIQIEDLNWVLLAEIDEARPPRRAAKPTTLTTDPPPPRRCGSAGDQGVCGGAPGGAAARRRHHQDRQA